MVTQVYMASYVQSGLQVPDDPRPLAPKPPREVVVVAMPGAPVGGRTVLLEPEVVDRKLELPPDVDVPEEPGGVANGNAALCRNSP